ncbi:MAG: DUF3224 domain-containing protein [Planctomycetota bacterium]|jgi:hypothetical protein
MTTINAEFKMTGWDEQPAHEGEDLPKFTRVKMGRAYTGDLEGEGFVEYLIVYPDGGEPVFQGYERFVGKTGDRSGSFVLHLSGTFGADGIVTESAEVVEGSGTEEFRGITGEGGWKSAHAESYKLSLDVNF